MADQQQKTMLEEELLQIKAVRSSKEKVDIVEFHPVQPWLAVVDRLSNVTVWNYESNEVGFVVLAGSACICLFTLSQQL